MDDLDGTIQTLRNAIALTASTKWMGIAHHKLALAGQNQTNPEIPRHCALGLQLGMDPTVSARASPLVAPNPSFPQEDAVAEIEWP